MYGEITLFFFTVQMATFVQSVSRDAGRRISTLRKTDTSLVFNFVWLRTALALEITSTLGACMLELT